MSVKMRDCIPCEMTCDRYVFYCNMFVSLSAEQLAAFHLKFKAGSVMRIHSADITRTLTDGGCLTDISMPRRWFSQSAWPFGEFGGPLRSLWRPCSTLLATAPAGFNLIDNVIAPSCHQLFPTFILALCVSAQLSLLISCPVSIFHLCCATDIS